MANEKQKPIKIEEKNKGKFTEYCNRKGYNGVTNACIEEGLASRSTKINKRAQFAKNARQWDKD